MGWQHSVGSTAPIGNNRNREVATETAPKYQGCTKGKEGARLPVGI